MSGAIFFVTPTKKPSAEARKLLSQPLLELEQTAIPSRNEDYVG
jgi:hypothetical protein